MRIQLLQNCLVEGRRRRAGELIVVDFETKEKLLAQGLAVPEPPAEPLIQDCAVAVPAVHVQPARTAKRRAVVAAADDGFAPIPEGD